MADRDVELNLTARDDASDVVEGVADQIERLPDDVEIDVEADARDAARSLDTFERQVDDLTGDARELRVTFRAEQLQREIRNALRDLERLDDPVDIEARTRDLERAQTELRELSELADRKYSIDIDADPRRTAQRAAGDVDLMRERGEGLQSALPALRGFTDELGAGAAQAGIAGQAMGDLGDFSLILGEKFGLSTAATTGLGTALGAAGLATVILGTALPALKALIESQDELDEATLAAVDALAEQLGLVDQLADAVDDAQTGDPFLTALLGQFDEDTDKLDEVTAAIVELGGTVDGDLSTALRRLESESGLADMLSELPGAADLSAEAFDKLVGIVANGGKSVDDVKRSVDATADTFNRTIREFVDDNGDAVEAIGTLRDAATGVDLGAAYAEALVEIQKTEEGVELLARAQANVGDGAPVEELIGEYDRLAKQTADTADTADDLADAEADAAAAMDEAVAAADRVYDAAVTAAEAQRDQADAALDQAGANRTAADANVRVAETADEWNVALFENSAALADVEAGSVAHNELLRDTTSAATSAADAVVAEAAALAEADGRTLSASASTSTWNESMIGAARQASGPLRQAIVDYIAQVNGIPPEKVSDILADTDDESVAAAGRALDGVSATRQAQIDAEAQTANANADLDDAARDRTATIYGDVTIRRNVRYDQASGTFVPASLAAPVDADPVAGAAARGAVPAASTGLYASSGGGVELRAVDTRPGVVNNVTVNVPRATDPRQLVATLNRWTRINGRP